VADEIWEGLIVLVLALAKSVLVLDLAKS